MLCWKCHTSAIPVLLHGTKKLWLCPNGSWPGKSGLGASATKRIATQTKAWECMRPECMPGNSNWLVGWLQSTEAETTETLQQNCAELESMPLSTITGPLGHPFRTLAQIKPKRQCRVDCIVHRRGPIFLDLTWWAALGLTACTSASCKKNEDPKANACHAVGDAKALISFMAADSTPIIVANQQTNSPKVRQSLPSLKRTMESWSSFWDPKVTPKHWPKSFAKTMSSASSRTEFWFLSYIRKYWRHSCTRILPIDVWCLTSWTSPKRFETFWRFCCYLWGVGLGR